LKNGTSRRRVGFLSDGPPARGKLRRIYFLDWHWMLTKNAEGSKIYEETGVKLIGISLSAKLLKFAHTRVLQVLLHQDYHQLQWAEILPWDILRNRM
jgi:hypothetical protein